ncbi:MAG: ATP-binding protein [Candidatus Omnitrophica bacterium]|jgi:signal transduction histidine kinase|nr:ATP-binding protein [Candidatus Omnitrophota bacterium]MDD5512350.1 ATP-binding protein [Candidatus Omnitrophota bacterium]
MPIKVLLIEDNLDHLEISKRILQKAGGDYEVDSASDSREALQKIFAGPYDVILCDYRLLEVTALDILREMNRKDIDTPFIVVTALGSEKIAVDMMKEGAYDYLIKDVLYSDTLDIVIKKAIERYRNKKEKEGLQKEIREAYNKLKETQDQLIQSEKLSALGQLASGVAHEVRNPLGIIMQGIDYLENKIANKESDIQDTLTMLKASVKRANRIIGSLLDFSRAASLDLNPEDLNGILESSLSLVKVRFKFENINIVVETKNDLPRVMADKNKLEQVFINILLNAMQSMPEGGKIVIRAFEREEESFQNDIGKKIPLNSLQPGEKVVMVEIEDSGPGVPEENLKKIFDPFFSTKGPNGGVGLGLSISRNIINMHKGGIYLESQLGKGTKVTVVLKIAEG